MKVLHSFRSAGIGGLEKLSIDLAIAQKKLNVETSIQLDIKGGAYTPKIEEAGIPLYVTGINSGFDFSPSKIKMAQTNFSKFDLIHFHGYSPANAIAVNKSKKPIVYTVHGLSKYMRRENKIKKRVYEYCKKNFLNRVDFIIANSNFILEGACKDYDLKNVEKKTILNGIDFSEFDYTDAPPIDNRFLEIASNNFVIGSVARFVREKRIERLIEAFHKYLSIGGNGKLLLVGDGKKMVEYKLLTRQLGIHENVFFTGFQKNVKAFYDLMDVCVFPSEFEPFGLVAVESLANGKPTLVFEDGGGLVEIVKPISQQDIVADPESLAVRLLFYQNNQIESVSQYDHRKQYANEHFSISRMAKQYIEVYKSVLNN